MEIVGSIILSITQSILFYGKEIGISMLLFEIICNGIMYYILYEKNKIKNKSGMLLLIPIFLLSSTYFIFANKTFYISNIFVILLLNLIMYVIVTNKKNYLLNHLHHALQLVINTITGYKEGINFIEQKAKEQLKQNDNINKENIKKISLSLLVVFVIVGIVLILLSSADMAFANLFSGMFGILKNLDIGTIFSFILRIIIIFIIFLLSLNLILKLQKEYKKDEKELKDNDEKYTFTIKLLLIALNIVYLIFCIIKLIFLFETKNSSFDYSSYARTGFFQLMFVSFINFGVILVSSRYNKKRDNKIKILNLLLVIFTIIIALSSMYRMYAYQMEYGLTYLRSFVYIILITEIIAFIPIIKYILNEKFDFIKWCFIIVISAYCIANYINLENIIIKQNITRTNMHPIDYKYISNIASEDSYDILEKRLQEDITDTEKLDILNILLKIANNTKDLSWQEFNISKYLMQRRNINIQELNIEIEKSKDSIEEDEKIEEIISKDSEYYIYEEVINKNETYFVEQVDVAMGSALWKIIKLTDNEKNYNVMSTITVSTPSKVKFFENGLGFIEKPNGIYCGSSELLITHDSGKTFEKINFPNGIFTLSNSNRRRLAKLLRLFLFTNSR